MNRVSKQVRDTKAGHEKGVFDLGVEFGTKWARENADAEHLVRLSEFRRFAGANFRLLGRQDREWSALGERAVPEDEFVRGVACGAMEVSEEKDVKVAG